MEFNSWYGSFQQFISEVRDEYDFRFWQRDPFDDSAEYTFDVEILSAMPIHHNDYLLIIKNKDNNTISMHRLSDILSDLGCTLISKED